MSVLTDIITTLKSKVDGMTIVGGYNYDYDNVDERRPGSKTYPNVLIEYPDELERDVNINVIDSYSSDRQMNFIVTVDDGTSPIDTALDNVLEDFKRLLEAEHDNLQLDGLVVGDLLESNRAYTHVRERPGQITILFNFFYRVRRSDPSLTI